MKRDFSTQQEVALHLEAVREAARNIETAVLVTLDIIRKFDGKQFTRRITNLAQEAVDKALGEHVVSVHFERNAYHYGVEFYLHKRSYPVERPYLRTTRTDWVYFDGDLWKSLNCWDGKQYALDASEFERRAKDIIRANALLVYTYQDAVERFAEYRLLYANALGEFQRACGAINPLFMEGKVETVNRAVSKAWEEQAEKAVAQ